MTANRNGSSRPAGADDEILDALRAPVRSPDLTGPIMHRVGFIPASPATTRRLRWRRVLSRSLLCGLAWTSGWVALVAYRSGPHARRPASMTVPAAVQEDGRRLRSTLETIRNLGQHVLPHFRARDS